MAVAGGREYNPGLFYGVEPIDVYDPRSDAWTRVSGLPPIPEDGDGGYGGRGFAGATLLGSGEVLVFGGTATHLVETVLGNGRVTFRPGGSAIPRTSSVVFDPITEQVRRVGSLNVGRVFPLAAAWVEGGGAFAIGGQSVIRSSPVRGEAYDPVVRTWSLLPEEPLPAVDSGPRLGTGLTDGAMLTWSVDEQNPGPATVTRLATTKSLSLFR